MRFMGVMMDFPKKRRWLADHDALPLRQCADHAHVVDLGRWEDRGMVRIDVDASCYRLTEYGRQQAKQSCGTCASWKQTGEHNFGQCWSPDRMDDDKQHAGITMEYDTCEVWRGK